MKIRERKIISALLAAFMVFGILPVSAFAAPVSGEPEVPAHPDEITVFGEKLPADLSKPYEDKDNVIGSGKGTLKWDPKTSTLTLNEVSCIEKGKAFVEIKAHEGVEITVKFVGKNFISEETKAVHTIRCVGGGRMNIECAPKASLTADAGEEASTIYSDGLLTVKGGNMNLTSGYSAVYSNFDVVMQDTAGSIKTSDVGVYSKSGDVIISGDKTNLNVETKFASLRGQNVTVTDATLKNLTSSEDLSIFAEKGAITLTNAKVKATSTQKTALYSAMGGIFLDNTTLNASAFGSANAMYAPKGEINMVNQSNVTLLSGEDVAIYSGTDSRLDNSKLNIMSPEGIGWFAKNSLTINNSQVDSNSGANPLNTDGNLVIDGSETIVQTTVQPTVQTTGEFPVYAGNVLTINNGRVKVVSNAGTALCGVKGVTINGGDVKATSEAKHAAIYSEEGDIRLQGESTVTATSKKDSAVFARNGKIYLDSLNVEAISGKGFAPFVGRTSGITDIEKKPEPNIVLGEDLSVPGNKVATTIWTKDSDGKYYADTVFVPLNMELNQDGLLDDKTVASTGRLEVGHKGADYTGVLAAIKEAKALDREIYEKDSLNKLDAAINDVNYNLDVREQAKVNAMENAIRTALNGLKKKGADYTKVQEAVDKVNALNPQDFRDFSKVQAAVNDVKWDLPITEQKAVNDMADAINRALKKLEYKDADYTKVKEATLRARELFEGDYKDFSKVKKAIDSVDYGLNVTKQEEVDAMAQAINDAIDALEYKDADYFRVETAIKKAKSLDKSLYKDFSRVKAAMDAVDRSLNISQQETVDAMARAIYEAIDALEYKDADYKQVDKALEKVSGLEKSHYKDFSKVQAAVDAVSRDKNVTQQSDVDAMAQAINDAVSALEFRGADYSRVDEALKKANALHKTDYKDFSKVEAAVKAVDRDLLITQQAEVDAMAQAINNAVAALEKKNDGSTSGGSTSGGSTSGGSTSGGSTSGGSTSGGSTSGGSTSGGTSGGSTSGGSGSGSGTSNAGKNPHTGDGRNALVWTAVLVLAIGGVTAVTVFDKKKNIKK